MEKKTNILRPGHKVIIRQNPHHPGVDDIVGTVIVHRPGEGFGGCDLVDVHYKNPKDGKGYTMEIRLPTAFLFQNVVKRVGVDPGRVALPKRITPQQYALQNDVMAARELKPGFRMGMMVDGSDSDTVQQPQKTMLSTSSDRQWGDPTTFNILELK